MPQFELGFVGTVIPSRSHPFGGVRQSETSDLNPVIPSRSAIDVPEFPLGFVLPVRFIGFPGRGVLPIVSRGFVSRGGLFPEISQNGFGD